MTKPIRRPLSVLRHFLNGEASGGLVLMGAAALALIVTVAPASTEVGTVSIVTTPKSGSVPPSVAAGNVTGIWTRAASVPGLVGIGGSLTAMMVTVVVCVAHRLGVPLSQT